MDMAENENLDVTGRAEFLRKGTTELNDFLPFGGEQINTQNNLFAQNPQRPPVQIENPNSDPQRPTIQKDYIQDNGPGIMPYSPNQLANTSQQRTQARLKKLQNAAYTLEDNSQYSKPFMYDSTATGAHKAKYKAYGQKTYDRIGFSPLVNNEEIFVNNTSIIDDYIRTATTSFFPMLGQGLIANPKSYAQLFQGNIGQDYDQSEDYEEYSNIGYSSRGGPLAFINNVFNSLGYSAGVMFEAGAEMALEGAIEGAVLGTGVEPGGGTAAGGVLGAAAGGAMGVVRGLFALPKSLFNMGRYGGKMLSSLKNAEKFTEAKNLFNTAIKSTANFVNPVNNTVTAYNQYDNLTGLARASRTAGGFFRDVIGMNAALSEGRLEGGFVENKTYERSYDEFWKKFNRAPDDKEQLELRKRSKIAGFQDTWKNGMLVYYSNKLAFPNLFGNKLFRNMSQTIGKIGDEFDLVYKAGKKGVQEGSYELVDYNIKNALKGFIKPANFGKASLMYFKTNLVEGAQEVLQDVLADATEEYYVNSYFDSTKANFDYSMATLGNAFGHQVSEQGFETFMSGFVMGAFLKPLDVRIPRWAQIQYNKYKMTPEEFKTYTKDRREYGETIKNAMNRMHKNPVDLINDRLVNYGSQSIISKKLADDETDEKEMWDGVNASFLSDVLTTLKAGTFKVWLGNFEKYQQMSDKDLESTLSLKEGQGAKMREEMASYVSRAKKIQARYDEGQNNYGKKKINLTNLKEGSPEFEKAQIYNAAIDRALYNLTFLGETFDLNLERINAMTQQLGSLDAIKNMPGADFQVLLDHERLTNNIKMLQTEIETLKQTGDQTAIAQAEKKERLLNKLQKFQDTQIDYLTFKKGAEALELLKREAKAAGKKANIEDLDAAKEIIDYYKKSGKNPKKDHKKAFEDLLKDLSGSDANYLKMMRELKANDGMLSLYKKLTDIYDLTLENKNIVPYINTLTDSDGFYEHVNRNFEWMRNLWLSRQNYYKEIIDQSIKMKENNDALRELSDQNIYVDLDQFADWTEDPNNLPEYFIDASQGSERIIPKGSVLYDKYVKILNDTARAQEQRAAGDPVDINGQLDEAIEDLMNKKSVEIDEADKQFKEAIKVETTFTYDELLQQEEELRKSQEAVVLTQTQRKAIEAEISKLYENMPADDPAAILQQLRDFVNRQVIPEGFLNDDKIVEFRDEFLISPSDDNMLGLSEKRMKEIKAEAIELYRSFPETYDDTQRRDAAGRYMAVFELINNYLDSTEVISSKEKQKKAEEKVNSDIINTTQAYADYQITLKQIDERYAALLEELKDIFIKRGASTTPTETEISTKTSWADIQKSAPALYKTLLDQFNKEVVEGMGINESDENFEGVKNNWLEQQGETINRYNVEKESAKIIKQQEAKQFKVPVLKYFKLPADIANITPSSRIEPYVKVIAALNNMVETGKAVNLKTKTTKDLTKEEITNIKSDIKEFQRLVDWLRENRVAEDETLFDVTDNIFTEKVKNRASEIEEIRDENGVLIERRIDGAPARRVTKEAEKLDIETTPGKEAFVYGPLKTQTKKKYDDEGNITETYDVPSPIMSAYDAIIESDDIADNKKLDAFLKSFTQWAMTSGAVFKDKTGKKINKEKYDLLKESLEQDFSRENVYNSVASLAFKHSSDAGNMLDDLIKDFLTRDGINFKEITKPEKVSKKAFDNMFGKNGFIRKFRDGIIDGDYIIVGAGDLVFDKTLFENGIVGETDLVAINTRGEVQIIDIKALGSGSWKIFNSDLELNRKINELKKKGLTEQDIERDSEVAKIKENLLKSKKQYFRIQQSIYRNLIWRMTGIKPTRIGLMGIEVDVDTEGNINDANIASVVPKGESTLELEYFPGVESIVPEPEVTTQPTQAPVSDIEVISENYTPELLRANPNKLFLFGDNNTRTGKGGQAIIRDEPNAMGISTKLLPKNTLEAFMSDDKLADNKAVIDSDIKKAKDRAAKEGKTIVLPKGGFGTGLAALATKAPQTFVYLNQRLQEEFGFNNTTGELAALEGTTEPTLEDDPERSNVVADNVGQKIIYNGKVGTLRLVNNVYSISYTDDTAEELLYQQKSLTDGSVKLDEIGAILPTIITNVGQIKIINGKKIDAEIISESRAKINGVFYRINKNKLGGVSSMSYQSNEKEINELEEDIRIYKSEIQKLQKQNGQLLSKTKSDDYKRQIEKLTTQIEAEEDQTVKAESLAERSKLQSELSDLNNQQNSNIRTIADYNTEVEILNNRIEDLKASNETVKITSGNLNDLIATLNLLPGSFKFYAGKTPQDQKKDLKSIEGKSVTPNISKRITEIMEKDFPNAYNKLIESGVSAISSDELNQIKDWTNKTIEELSTLGTAEAIANNLTDELDSQINVLNGMLNDLELIKLNKDGSISKKPQTAASKVFGPKKISDGSGISAPVKSTGEQTEGVPSGKGAGTRQGTVDEAKKSLEESLAISAGLSGINVSMQIKSTKQADKLIDKMRNATTEQELNDAYFEALNYLSNNPGKIDPNIIANTFTAVTEEKNFNDENPTPTYQSIKKGTYLMPKTPMFKNENPSPVEIVKKGPKAIVIKDINTNESMNIKPEDLSKFVTMTEEGLKQLGGVELTQEDIREIEENAQVIANTLENTAELNKAADEVKNAQTKGSFKEKLIKKECDIKKL